VKPSSLFKGAFGLLLTLEALTSCACVAVTLVLAAASITALHADVNGSSVWRVVTFIALLLTCSSATLFGIQSAFARRFDWAAMSLALPVILVALLFLQLHGLR
jgi:hypothetical protein